MSNLDYYIGAQIVCVDVNYQHMTDLTVRSGREMYPVLDQIYTIRDIVTWLDTTISFHLEEIVNETCFIGVEISFYQWHFKPVYKTDIGVFEQLLVPTSKKKVLEHVD